MKPAWSPNRGVAICRNVKGQTPDRQMPSIGHAPSAKWNFLNPHRPPKVGKWHSMPSHSDLPGTPLGHASSLIRNIAWQQGMEKQKGHKRQQEGWSDNGGRQCVWWLSLRPPPVAQSTGKMRQIYQANKGWQCEKAATFNVNKFFSIELHFQLQEKWVSI